MSFLNADDAGTLNPSPWKTRTYPDFIALLQEWWTHLWLNEGFASWIEYLCVDHCFPDYDIWTQSASSDFTRALELDALNNSHPIEVSASLLYLSLPQYSRIPLSRAPLTRENQLVALAPWTPNFSDTPLATAHMPDR